MSETKVTQPTARQAREWRKLCSVAEEEWGGSPKMESLYEYRLNNEVMYEIAAEKIEAASHFLVEKQNLISAAQQVRLSEEVEPAMCEFSELMDALLARGFSLAAVCIAMHNELSNLSEEIADPREDAHAFYRGAKATKAPLFPTVPMEPQKQKTAKAAKA